MRLLKNNITFSRSYQAMSSAITLTSFVLFFTSHRITLQNQSTVTTDQNNSWLFSSNERLLTCEVKRLRWKESKRDQPWRQINQDRFMLDEDQMKSYLMCACAVHISALIRLKRKLRVSAFSQVVFFSLFMFTLFSSVIFLAFVIEKIFFIISLLACLHNINGNIW